MPRSGTKVLLAACIAGFLPFAALAQRVISLEGPADRAGRLGPTPASRVVVAQTLVTPNGAAPVPNVNDCTFIRDPIALRDCINLYEGQRLGPGPRTNALRPNLITDEELLDAAGPIPGSAKGRSSGGRERVTPTPRRAPNAAYIDQVTPAR